MSEFAGPNVCDCPQRIIKLLSPLNDENDVNGWARGWRKRVDEYWNKRKELQNNNGNVLKTKEPISFTSGDEYQYFKKIGRTTFAGITRNNEFFPLSRVRVNLSQYDYEVVPNVF